MEKFDEFDAIEMVKKIFVRHGFKLYEPQWRYNKLVPAFLAVRPQIDERKDLRSPLKDTRSACLFRVEKGKVTIGWQQPNRKDADVDEEIDHEIGQFVRRKPRLLGRFRHDKWDQLINLVVPSQRLQFEQQIYTTRLE